MPDNNSFTDPVMRACATLADVASGRSKCYRWLSVGFYPPDEDFLLALNTGCLAREMTTALERSGVDCKSLLPLLERLGETMSGFHLRQLQSEYDRLFGRSLERVSPLESTYRWRDVQDVTKETSGLEKELERLYGQFGLSPAAGMHGHVAVELEFLSFLCWRESQHWLMHNLAAARDLRQQQHNFLNEHLARWFPEFALRVCTRHADLLYSWLTRLTKSWLEIDLGSGQIGAA